MKNNKMLLLCIICLFACVFMFSCGSDNSTTGRSLDESNMGGMGTATDYNVAGNTARNDNMYSDNNTTGYDNNGSHSSYGGDGNVNTNNGSYDGGNSYNTGSDMSLDGAVGDLTK